VASRRAGVARPARTRYGTFHLGSDTPQGLVHLRSELPEVIAIGKDAMLEMIKGVWPLGGPATEVSTDRKRVHVTTPECEFTYEHIRTERDTAGWYFLFKLVYTSDTYQEFLSMR
jgi:hypothetical protein